ncbi:hypothetical protein FACS189430_03940 [Bacteroidia bacterium]|nr:hypothetical protein FACS189430_03940 [Bacteroidia bacterium]
MWRTQILKNHYAYPVWTITEIHGETIEGEPFGKIFVNVDYDLIKSLPLDIKKIIAYYSTRAGISDEQSWAAALGQFSTVKEAQDFLLKDWVYNEHIPQNETLGIAALYIQRDDDKIIIAYVYPTQMWNKSDADIFKIDNGKILFLKHEDNVDIYNHKIIIAP